VLLETVALAALLVLLAQTKVETAVAVVGDLKEGQVDPMVQMVAVEKTLIQGRDQVQPQAFLPQAQAEQELHRPVQVMLVAFTAVAVEVIAE
jgi:hypothetical protein